VRRPQAVIQSAATAKATDFCPSRALKSGGALGSYLRLEDLWLGSSQALGGTARQPRPLLPILYQPSQLLGLLGLVEPSPLSE
jgi:hypothetical protein